MQVLSVTMFGSVVGASMYFLFIMVRELTKYILLFQVRCVERVCMRASLRSMPMCVSRVSVCLCLVIRSVK